VNFTKKQKTNWKQNVLFSIYAYSCHQKLSRKRSELQCTVIVIVEQNTFGSVTITTESSTNTQ